MFENTNDSYTDICGCIWKNGRRVHVCPRHKHKDGIRPDKIRPYRSHGIYL